MALHISEVWDDRAYDKHIEQTMEPDPMAPDITGDELDALELGALSSSAREAIAEALSDTLTDTELDDVMRMNVYGPPTWGMGL